MRRILILSVTAFGLIGGMAACSSGPEVKKQQYAELKDNRVFEYEFPVVWKGIESALRNYKILERDPSEVSSLELKKLRKRTLETDWISTQSRDKYHEFKVNGFPQKRYLWSRIKYKLTAATVMGGTEVTVSTAEEVERLNEDGSSAGYERVDEVDSSRANEVLERIGVAILSAAP